MQNLATGTVAADSSVWLDVEQIALGQDWRRVIEEGMRVCDEFILVASRASLASPVVREELALAGRYGKPINAFLLERDIDTAPLAHTHYCVVPTATADQVRATIAGLLSPTCLDPYRGRVAPHLIKSAASRSVWPRYKLSSHSSEQSLRDVCDGLRTAAAESPDRGPVVLNHGLLECADGRFDSGLPSLARYSRAANTMAGWYFLALYLPRGRNLRDVDLPTVRNGCEAIARATALARNPLAILLDALYQVAGQNRSPVRLDEALAAFQSAPHTVNERPSEYLRFYVAMRPSISEFGSYAEDLVSAIRRITAYEDPRE